jgi:hypothetical protein
VFMAIFRSAAGNAMLAIVAGQRRCPNVGY